MYTRYATIGRRQVVRHQVLVLAFGGSNPSALAKDKSPASVGDFSLVEVKRINRTVRCLSAISSKPMQSPTTHSIKIKKELPARSYNPFAHPHFICQKSNVRQNYAFAEVAASRHAQFV